MLGQINFKPVIISRKIVKIPLHEILVCGQNLHIKLMLTFISPVIYLSHLFYHPTTIEVVLLLSRHSVLWKLPLEHLGNKLLIIIELSGKLPKHKNEQAIKNISNIDSINFLLTSVFNKQEYYPEDSHQIKLTLFVDYVILTWKALKNRSVFFVYSVGQLHIVDLYTQPLRTFPPFVALTSHHLQQRLLWQPSWVSQHHLQRNTTTHRSPCPHCFHLLYLPYDGKCGKNFEVQVFGCSSNMFPKEIIHPGDSVWGES